MNLQQLEYIVAVDSLRNFSKAADYCHVTQATLSAMIRKLEAEIGVIIFDRKFSPVVTTEQGKEIIEEARYVLFHASQIKESAQKSQNRVEGIVKMGIIPTVSSNLLPIILKPILDKYPDLKLVIHELTTENLVSGIKDGKIDFGILATPLSDQRIEENILYYEAMYVYGVEQTLTTYIATEDLNDKKVWLLEEGHCFRNQAIDICNLQKSEMMPDNLEFESNSFDTLLNITDNFGGITLIPELYYKSMSKERQNKSKLFDKPIPVREISIVYYRPFAKLRVISHLTSFIRELMKGQLITENYKNSELSIIGI